MISYLYIMEHRSWSTWSQLHFNSICLSGNPHCIGYIYNLLLLLTRSEVIWENWVNRVSCPEFPLFCLWLQRQTPMNRGAHRSGHSDSECWPSPIHHWTFCPLEHTLFAKARIMLKMRVTSWHGLYHTIPDQPMEFLVMGRYPLRRVKLYLAGYEPSV